MSIACPRCHEQVDGVPDGCADPSCPRLELEEMAHDQYDGIMADGKAESDANAAYGAAKDAVIAAARRVAAERNESLRGFCDALATLETAIAALGAMEEVDG